MKITKELYRIEDLFLEEKSKEDFMKFSNEKENGLEVETSIFKSFRVEQKITQFESSGQLSAGSFVNGNSEFKKLNTWYFIYLLSDKERDLVSPTTGEILGTLKYGIGIRINLEASDIETKVNANFSVLAAAAKMNKAKVNYYIENFGVTDPGLIGSLPSVKQAFSNESFEKVISFAKKAKKHFAEKENISKLYPIEFLVEKEIQLETKDYKSIYYGVKNLSKGKSLNRAILEKRDNYPGLNENVIQFVYKYFGLDDAYRTPGVTQVQNAKKWQLGKFNKVEKPSFKGTWVTIDPSFTGETGNPEENYKLHPLPDNWADAAKKLDDKFSEVSIDFSSNLKISGIMDADSKFNSLVLIKDIAWYIDTDQGRPENSMVIQTRYGVGVRLMIKFSNIEFGTEINFQSIGAVSELGLANIEYSISGIGFVDNSLLDLLPPPQNINEETVGDLLKSFDKVAKKLSAEKASELTPKPTKIRVEAPDKVDPLIEAQAMVFSTIQIKDRIKLSETQRAAKEYGIDGKLIADVYADFGIKEDRRITIDEKRDAKEWLESIE